MAFARTTVSVTGNLTLNNNQILNVSNTAQLFTGMCVYGTGIKADTIITAIAGTTVTMSQTASATGTGVTITGQYITQTGTDTDPSGLSAMTGVTTITSGTGTRQKSVYDLGANQLRIQGTFTHDPDQHTIMSGLQMAIRFESGTYNYGIETVVNGKSSFSKGCGLELTYSGGIASNFPIQQTGGTFNWKGGIVRFGGAWSITNGSFIQKGDTSVAFNNNTGTQIQLRTILPPANMRYEKIKLAGVNQVFFWTTQTYGAISAALENGAIQTPAGLSATQSYDNFVFANNQAPADFYINQLSGANSTLSIVKNPDVVPRVSQLNTGAYGVVETRETLTFNVSDASGVSAGNVVGYVKDSNNGARTNENQLTAYTSDQVYVATSTAGGVLSLGDILVNVQMRNPSATNTVKQDYRGNYGSTSVDFNVYLGGYEFNSAVTRQTLLGNGGKTVGWTLFSDSNVTASRTAALAYLGTKFAIDPVAKTVTVLANATYDEMYDAAKAYKYQGTQTAVETPTISDLILSTSGSALTAYTGWTLVVNTGVTLASGTKFSFAQFTTVTLNGSGKITAVYGSTAGVSTSLELRSVKPGASYIVANNATKTTIQFGVNNEVTSQDYTVYFPPGSSGTQVYVARQGYGDQFDYEVITLVEGAMWYQFTDILDEGISETNKATVAAYTDLENTNKLYDYIAYYRTTEPGIKLGNIVVRAGTQLQFGSYSGVVNQSATNVLSISGNTITIKASALAGTTKYDTIIATPPATWTPATVEVVSVNIEDANGDSSVTIQAGSVSTYEIWKITDATPPDNYATGTLLATVGPGKYRFIHADGYKMVIRDQTSSYRVVVEMEKGVYTAELFFGAQVQLAQAATVEQIYTLTQTLEVDVSAIKGTGFIKDKHSLTNIKKKAALAAALSA